VAKDTGKGSRKGAVKNRTQVKNPKTGDFAKRNETKGNSKRGEFMDNKKKWQTLQRRRQRAGQAAEVTSDRLQAVAQFLFR
jgi:hypothetical protein